jgi:hypothetical protein
MILQLAFVKFTACIRLLLRWYLFCMINILKLKMQYVH